MERIVGGAYSQKWLILTSSSFESWMERIVGGAYSQKWLILTIIFSGFLKSKIFAWKL